MTNYRVRQVLALGRLPERQLRLLVALATWMSDDTRTVRLGFDALTAATGNVRNTVKAARADAAAAGRLTWQSSHGRGHLTVWTVLCLPEKGVNVSDPLPEPVKGVNPATEKGSTEPDKRGQPQTADLQEPDHGLNRMAKSSGSLSVRVRELLSAAGGDVSERESDQIIARIKGNGGRDVLAIVRKNIADGDAGVLIDEARQPCKNCQDGFHDHPDSNRIDQCPCWCLHDGCPACVAGDHKRCADRGLCPCDGCDESTTRACNLNGSPGDPGYGCENCPGFMPDGETWCMCYCHGLHPHIKRTTARTKFDPVMATNGHVPATSISILCGDNQHDTCSWSHCRCRCHITAEAKAALERIRQEKRR
jgi:hypothetical protein